MSDKHIIEELLHTIKLDSQHRGQIAELAFMRKATNLGFSVAKPWGESDRYDFVVRVGRTFWRVQVKSVLGVASTRKHYRVMTMGGKLSYSRDEIDFLVAYIFAEDTWYVFPAHVVENRTCVCVTPSSKRCHFQQYREAWQLMTDISVDPAVPHEPAAEPAPAPASERVEEIFAVASI